MPTTSGAGGGMSVLRAANYRRMPWKNGAGETTEVAVFPSDAGLEDFDWRISMARVATDGPFSRFDGVDRTLCILEGTGLDLVVAGNGRVRMTTGTDPHGFPGDIETEGILVDGPIIDLNVMSRRGRVRHAMRTFRLGEAMLVECAAPTVLVLVHGGGCSVEHAGRRAELSDLDCAAIAPASGHVRLDGLPEVRAFVIQLDISSSEFISPSL